MTQSTRLSRILFSCFGLLILFAAGCATNIRVTSSPAGAKVYSRGIGRPSYRWRKVGETPLTYRAYYNAVWVQVQWADDTYSLAHRVDLLGNDTATISFDKSAPTARSLESGLPSLDARRNTVEASMSLPPMTWDTEGLVVVPPAPQDGKRSGTASASKILRDELAETGYFKLVPARSVQEALGSVPGKAPCSDATCLAELGRRLKVNVAAGGTLTSANGTFDITLRLVHASDSQTIAEVKKSVESAPDGPALATALRASARLLARDYARWQRAQLFR